MTKRVVFAVIVVIVILLTLSYIGNKTGRVTSYDRTQTQRANIATWDAQWNIDLTATAAAE